MCIRDRSNGHAEAAVRVGRAKIRTLRHATEKMLGMQLEATHAILPWMVQHAAAQISRGRPGSDGKTAYMLRYGKDFKMTSPVFAEK
eukprot:1476576-Prorocentrum_lima.AAC.1